jgi:4-hydroxymandelate oxidase
VVPTATVLAGVVDAVGGGVPVMVDGGVRSAADALRALALGASLVGVGRPALWALATEGGPGVARVLGELTEELRNLMASCGAATISELDRGFVRDVP